MARLLQGRARRGARRSRLFLSRRRRTPQEAGARVLQSLSRAPMRQRRGGVPALAGRRPRGRGKGMARTTTRLPLWTAPRPPQCCRCRRGGATLGYRSHCAPPAPPLATQRGQRAVRRRTGRGRGERAPLAVCRAKPPWPRVSQRGGAATRGRQGGAAGLGAPPPTRTSPCAEAVLAPALPPRRGG